MEGPPFLIDLNAARLAGWLRALGYDAALSPGLDADGLIRLARREGRIVLTRNARLAGRRAVARGDARVLLLRSDNHWDQLRQVVTELGLEPARAFSRCIRCNSALVGVPREEVRDRVPPFVFRTQAAFMRCPSCMRVYWQGSHARNMRWEMERLLEGGP